MLAPVVVPSQKINYFRTEPSRGRRGTVAEAPASKSITTSSQRLLETTYPSWKPQWLRNSAAPTGESSPSCVPLRVRVVGARVAGRLMTDPRSCLTIYTGRDTVIIHAAAMHLLPRI